MSDCVYFSAQPPRAGRVPLADQLTQIVSAIKKLPPGHKRTLLNAELSNIAGVIAVLGARVNDSVGRMSPLRQPGQVFRE